MCKGRTAEAEILTKSIGQHIACVQETFLEKASLKNTKHLWSLVNDKLFCAYCEHDSSY